MITIKKNNNQAVRKKKANSLKSKENQLDNNKIYPSMYSKYFLCQDFI